MSDATHPSRDATPPPDAVRDALRALATGTAPADPPTFRGVVADATAATACAVEAAAFLRAGRLAELARAVADAERAGATDAAKRGRRALETLRRLDAAARQTADAGTDAAVEPTPDGRSDGDHFHRAHGTVLPKTGQPTDR